MAAFIHEYRACACSSAASCEPTCMQVMTTKTIMAAFIRKYALVSSMPEEFLLRLFVFHSVKIAEAVHFQGERSRLSLRPELMMPFCTLSVRYFLRRTVAGIRCYQRFSKPHPPP